MSIKRIADGIMRAAGIVPPVDRASTTLTDGSPVTEDHRELKPNGQQKGYIVLSAEERARGFVRPVRDAYVHVGRPAPKGALRDLTDEERKRWSRYGYVKYEPYPTGEGRFWTQPMLDRIGKGCRTKTTMGRSLAETYARDYQFYSGTFCVHCRDHFPVGEDGEFIWDDGARVGT